VWLPLLHHRSKLAATRAVIRGGRGADEGGSGGAEEVSRVERGRKEGWGERVVGDGRQVGTGRG
jgi:hypothetical protein